MILGAAMFDGQSGTPLMLRGKHAVAVTGFSLGLSAPIAESETGFQLEASRIDKLYVHDDQVGPFARMVFDGVSEKFTLRPGAAPLPSWSLKTSWRREDGSLGMRAVPDMLLLPLYHKIRIPYAHVERIIRTFDVLVTEEAPTVILSDRLTWDIHLITGSDFKNAALSDSLLPPSARLPFLVKPLPRFIWRSRASNRSGAVIDVLFDATDIEQGQLVLDILEYSASLSGLIRTIATKQDVRDECSGHPVDNMFDWIARHPNPFATP
jgi:hypothetical protein